MRLNTFSYAEFAGTPRAWSVSDLTLGDVNLVVGKNATGKSRTLNTVHGLARILSGRMRPADLATGTYHAAFTHDGRELGYHLTIHDREVAHEEFTDGTATLLTRAAGGVGQIHHAKLSAMIDFQTPTSEAAVVARRDSLQHPFLEPLHQWSEGVRHYAFGGTMGRESMTIFVKDGPKPDPRDVDAVVGLFQRGSRTFPDRFVSQVKSDMRAVGYDLEDLGLMVPTGAPFRLLVNNAEPTMLYAKETALPGITQQWEMSQGMFRALSVIIHLTYATLADQPSLVIIDDIGEGLDFERSCKLIDLLRQRAQASQIQLLMATNDKFVMNSVPLDEWSVLQRRGSQVKVLNHQNSAGLFEEFRFTGLSNFSFLEMDFANAPPMELATP